MDLTQALRDRRSIRAFSDRPVPGGLVEEILSLALESPSWSNTQPYRVAVASGAVREQLAADLSQRFSRLAVVQRARGWRKLLAALRHRKVLPDGDIKTVLDYPAELQKRRVATGVGLYQVLGIGRQDHAARDAQMARNFVFFDAPVALFIFAHRGLREYGILDAGIFLQSLMLAAHDRGLGTCAEGALGLWRSPLEKYFDIPDDYQLVCGVALGYPTDNAVNRFKPDRRAVGEILVPPRQR